MNYERGWLLCRVERLFVVKFELVEGRGGGKKGNGGMEWCIFCESNGITKK